MILEVGRPGHLEDGVGVLLCFTYCFAMPRFWGEKFYILVRLTILVIDFSGFKILWEWGGCTEVGLHR